MTSCRNKYVILTSSELISEGFKDWVGQNQRIIEYEKSGDWPGLLRYALDTHPDFNDVNWATVFSKLGRMSRTARSIKSDESFVALRKVFEKRLEEEGMSWMGMQAIGNILHAHGVMRLKSPAVYLALDSDAPRIVLSGLPRHISNCIYALARLGHSGSTFAAAVETKDVAGFVAGEGQPQD
ncbi:hypothetical protein TrRE_jg9838, partial [Triparma retinervis]